MFLSSLLLGILLIFTSCVATIGSSTLIASRGSSTGTEMSTSTQYIPAFNGSSSEIGLAGFQKAMSVFTENKGQFDDGVRFVAIADFGKVLFCDSKVIYGLNIYKEGKVVAIDQITLTFDGSNLVRPYGIGLQSQKSNFFIGDSSNWVVGARNYRSIAYQGLWDGIDLVYKFSDNGLKYEFTVAPFIPVDLVRVHVDGASLAQGTDSLSLITARGCLTDGNLVALQEGSGKTMQASFIAQRSEFGFSVQERDISQALTIDPLIYSTYFGGSGEWDEYGNQVCADSNGNAYLVGTTTSTDFPVTDSYHGTFDGGMSDAFVLKLSANGSDLIYSTFIGGNGSDGASSIFVDTSGNAFVSGSTNSTNFPLANPYQGTYGGGERDAFILKLNPAGDALLYSTYIGGDGSDGGRRISVDGSGNVYMTGDTDSVNFPLVNAFQSAIAGMDEIFVLKLNASGDSLLYSTYLGGNDSDFVYSIAIDSSGDAFVTGVTLSPDFPIANAYQSTYAGDGDIFITKLSPDGGSLIYSTYIGTSKDETGNGIAVDASGCAYVTGYTGSSNFPLVNAFKSAYGGGYQDGFVLKLNPAGNALIYSSYIGGSGNWDEGDSIAVDASGNAYVAGWTNSPNFPLVNAFQSNYGGGETDLYVLKIHPSGNPLLFSTYYGGSDEEDSPFITLDAMGNFYVSGTTYSPNFPTFNAYQDHLIGWRDAFIFKFQIPSLPSTVTNVTASAGSGQVILTWEAPSNDGGSSIIGYKVYRGTASGAETRLIELGNVLTYTDSPLTNGQTYFYKVSAVNSVGESPLSNEASATPATIPTVPRGLQAIAGDSVVDLNWTAPEYAGPGTLTYNLLRNGSQIWSGTELTYSDITVINGVIYSYQVAANNSIGWGPNSTAVLATPMPITVPTAPIGLIAVPGNMLIDLNWTEPSYRGPGPITYHLFRDSALIWSGTAIAHQDAPLIKGVQYLYTVAAQNSIGWGPNCTAILATAVGVPDAPWGLNAATGNGNASLSWNAVNYTGPGALTYHLFRDGIEVWSGITTSHHDTGLSNGQAFVYKVAASNAVGRSVNSSSVSVTPQGPPSTPRGLTVASGDSYVDLNWTTPDYVGPGTLTYHLYRNGTLIWNGTAMVYHDAILTNGVQYSYTVAAQNDIGWSANSSSVSGTPTNAQKLPGVPTGLHASAGDGQVTLTWNAPSQSGSSAITGYKLYRGTSTGPLVLVANGTGTTHIDVGLTNGQTYHYKVSATNSVGEGAMTEEVVVTPSASNSNGVDLTLVIIIVIVAIIGVLGVLFYRRKRG